MNCSNTLVSRLMSAVGLKLLGICPVHKVSVSYKQIVVTASALSLSQRGLVQVDREETVSSAETTTAALLFVHRSSENMENISGPYFVS